GTNSLLDIVVFGRRGGAAMAAFVADRQPPGLAAGFENSVKATVSALLSGQGTERVADIRAELQAEMTLNASVFRTDESLRAVSATIDRLRERYRDVAVTDQSRRFNYELSEALELGYLLDVAQALVAAALARTESRGGHFRDDHPLRDDANWMRHSLAYRLPDGGIRLDYKPVVGGPYLPMERKY
ncbi:MAG: succinate dehydrogenase/fumarate reductase flavoprotein subunit, partial [Acidimicrobiales bacterium]